MYQDFYQLRAKMNNGEITKQTISKIPRYFFIFFAIFGFCFIWLSKHFKIEQAYITFTSVSLIIYYAFLAYRNRLFHIREDQIGDNSYYLGFLYTLSSLSYALYTFSKESEFEIMNIIGSFGVALWSTIFGIAIRVFFAQLYRDSDDIEKSAQTKVAETSNKLVNELYKSSISFNSYTRSLKNSVQESFQDVRENLAKNLINNSEQFSQSSKLILEQNEVIIAKLEESINKIQASTQEISQSLSNLAKIIDQKNQSNTNQNN